MAGLKVTKSLEVRPWRTTVNLGAFVDVRHKTVSGFSRVEVDAGKCGTLVGDIDGLELQKDWRVPLGAAESQLSLSVGVGVTTLKPYINIDIRPIRRAVKAATAGWKLYTTDNGLDLQPSIPLSRNASITVPLTLSTGKIRAINIEGLEGDRIDHVKLHAHGAIACYKFPSFVIKGGDRVDNQGDEEEKGVVKKNARDAKSLEAKSTKGEVNVEAKLAKGGSPKEATITMSATQQSDAISSAKAETGKKKNVWGK
uniref:Uncharacterized protein n=1 Tax=Mantoniella antarctica TaxID=81844 RepID=A0A7S0X356_9CHLO